jgi:Fe-S-cluster containining protein
MLKPDNDVPACAGCGTCCRLLVELAPSDEVPESYVAVHDGVRCMDQEGDGTCVALDRATKLCTIYERRPGVCRSFDRGSALCRQVLTRYGLLRA